MTAKPHTRNGVDTVLAETPALHLGINTGFRVGLIERDGKPWVLLFKVDWVFLHGPPPEKWVLALPAMPGSAAPFFDAMVPEARAVGPFGAPGKPRHTLVRRPPWETVYEGKVGRVAGRIGLQLLVFRHDDGTIYSGIGVAHRNRAGRWEPGVYLSFGVSPAELADFFEGFGDYLRSLDADVPAHVAAALRPPRHGVRGARKGPARNRGVRRAPRPDAKDSRSPPETTQPGAPRGKPS